MVDGSLFDDLDLDRKFLNLSANMANVFSWTYGMLGGRLIAPIDPNKFDNASSKLAEIGIRMLIILGAIASFCFAGTFILLGAVILSAGAKIFRSLGYYFQKEGFTHIRGKAEEKKIENGRAKIMEWNIRGHGGGLHYSEGGVVHWRSRINRIIEDILKEDPDVIVLQEVYDTLLIEEIVAQLESRYARFFTHLGNAGVWGEESGIMVITKCAVHQFSHTDFAKTDEKVKRGFEIFEIKALSEGEALLRIISSQLSPGKSASELRMSQVSQIIDTLAREKKVLSTLFVGSLNIDRDSSDEGAYLSNYLYHSYLDSAPTHSDELVSQWAPVFEGQEKSDDFVSVVKRNPDGDCRTFPVQERGVRLIYSHLVPGFDEDHNTKTARSDHHAVVTEVDGLKVH